MESFSIKLTQPKYSSRILKIANAIMIVSALVLVLTFTILKSPIPMEFKAILFVNETYIIILPSTGIVFMIGIYLMLFGSKKYYRGLLYFSSSELKFELKKESFDIPFSEIVSVQQKVNFDNKWEWEFLTTSIKFSLIFNQIKERYNAEALLKEVLKNKLETIVDDE